MRIVAVSDLHMRKPKLPGGGESAALGATRCYNVAGTPTVIDVDTD